MAVAIRSYASTRLSFFERYSELIHLYRYQSENLSSQLQTLIQRIRLAESRVRAVGGPPIVGSDVLEIGSGQRFRQMNYFARCSRAVGIDLDELVQGPNLLAYVRMLRHNGPLRVAKTAGRRLLGLDRAFDREMTQQLGLSRPNRFDLRRMDAANMSLPNESFDLVYSYSVFEHIPDCARVLEEIKRVLRPGGCAYISLHLYTSDSGCHDPRIFARRRDDLPHWSHLRPAYAARVRPNAYLNRVRLADWDSLFTRHMPGVVFHRDQFGRARLAPVLNQIRAGGELTDYTDDELLTTDYVALWRKPA